MRRVYICATHVLNEEIAEKESKDYEQLSLFTDYEEMELRKEKHNKEKEEEKLLAETILNIQGKYGKNSLIKGMNLEEGGTTIERNKQVGGHKA